MFEIRLLMPSKGCFHHASIGVVVPINGIPLVSALERCTHLGYIA
jgi:hypothetical protein